MNLPVPTVQPEPQSAERRRLPLARLRSLFEATLRRPRLAFGAACAVALLVLLAGLLPPRPYTSTAALMISPRALPALDNRTLAPTVSTASALVDSEIEILRSPQLAALLVDQLNLTRARAWGGLPGATPISASRRDHVITNVRRAIRVRRQGETYVASVSITARSRARAHQMVTTFIELYFAQRMQRPAQGTRTADRWLAQQLDQLRAEMRAKEDAVATLRAQRRQVSPEDGAQQTLVDQAAVQAARADLADKQARLRQVRLDPSMALQSSTIRELQTREADASRLEVEFSERYGAQHPKLQSVRAERESVRAQIRSEISRVAAHLNSEVEAARRRLAELETRLTEVATSLSPSSDADSAQLRELEHDAAAIRARYQSYLARQQEMAQDRLRPTGVALVAAASMPLRQDSPNLPLLLLLAVGLGLPAGVGLAYLAALADHTLRDLDEVERELGLPGLVSISDLRSPRDSVEGADRGPAGYVAAKPHSKFADSFRSLQQLIFSARSEDGIVVAITSALPEEGKTSTALGLARTAVLSGKSVLLINCDTRRRTNGALRLTPLEGLSEVLTAAAPWSDVVIRDDSGVHILPLSVAELPPSDMFGSAAMQHLLSELRESYDLIVLDCAPVLAVAETRSVVRLADATVIVARAGRTPKTTIASAIEQVRQAGGIVLGVALNGVKPYPPGLHFSFDLRNFRIVDKRYDAESA